MRPAGGPYKVYIYIYKKIYQKIFQVARVPRLIQTQMLVGGWFFSGSMANSFRDDEEAPSGSQCGVQKLGNDVQEPSQLNRPFRNGKKPAESPSLCSGISSTCKNLGPLNLGCQPEHFENCFAMNELTPIVCQT